MKNDIEQLRRRMDVGAPIESDLTWCRRRLGVLEEWEQRVDEALTMAQVKEMHQLRFWLTEYAE